MIKKRFFESTTKDNSSNFSIFDGIEKAEIHITIFYRNVKIQY